MSPVPIGIANGDRVSDRGCVSVAFLAAVTPCVPSRYDEVHLEPDQPGRQVGQPVDPTHRISIVDDNILALNPPELAQPLPERVQQGRPIGRGRHPKKTYPMHLSRVLRVGGERRGKNWFRRDQEVPRCTRSTLFYPWSDRQEVYI